MKSSIPNFTVHEPFVLWCNSTKYACNLVVCMYATVTHVMSRRGTA